MPYENSVIITGKLLKGHIGYFQWLKNITKNQLYDRDFLIRRFEDKISIENKNFRNAFLKAKNLGMKNITLLELDIII